MQSMAQYKLTMEKQKLQEYAKIMHDTFHGILGDTLLFHSTTEAAVRMGKTSAELVKLLEVQNSKHSDYELQVAKVKEDMEMLATACYKKRNYQQLLLQSEAVMEKLQSLLAERKKLHTIFGNKLDNKNFFGILKLLEMERPTLEYLSKEIEESWKKLEIFLSELDGHADSFLNEPMRKISVNESEQHASHCSIAAKNCETEKIEDMIRGNGLCEHDSNTNYFAKLQNYDTESIDRLSSHRVNGILDWSQWKETIKEELHSMVHSHLQTWKARENVLDELERKIGVLEIDKNRIQEDLNNIKHFRIAKVSKAKLEVHSGNVDTVLGYSTIYMSPLFQAKEGDIHNDKCFISARNTQNVFEENKEDDEKDIEIQRLRLELLKLKTLYYDQYHKGPEEIESSEGIAYEEMEFPTREWHHITATRKPVLIGDKRISIDMASAGEPLLRGVFQNLSKICQDHEHIVGHLISQDEYKNEYDWEHLQIVHNALKCLSTQLKDFHAKFQNKEMKEIDGIEKSKRDQSSFTALVEAEDTHKPIKQSRQLSQPMHHCSMETESLRNELSKSEEGNRQLANSLLKKAADLADAKITLEASEYELKNAKNEVKILQEEVRSLQDNLSKHELEATALRQRITEKETEIQKAHEQIHVFKTDIDLAISKMEGLTRIVLEKMKRMEEIERYHLEKLEPKQKS